MSPQIETAKTIDMYLIAGQSNAAGYSYHENALQETFPGIGYAGETDKFRETGETRSSNVSSFEDFYWEVKAGYGTASDRIGPEYGMAKVLSTYYSQDNPAFIFKSAAGGTSLRNITNGESGQFGNWYPRSLWESGFTPSNDSGTGLQYYNFVENFRTVYNELVENGYAPKVKGMVWMQGCADYTLPLEYEPILKTFISDIRYELETITGDDTLEYMPFVIGEIPTSIVQHNNPHVPTFNEMQRRVADAVAAVETVQTSDLVIVKADGSYSGRDAWHFSCADAITLGQRFANKVVEMNASDGVSIGIKGQGDVSYTIDGNNVALTIQPEEGYRLSSLLINGENVTSQVVNNQYTFEKGAYVAVLATFRLDGDSDYDFNEEEVMDIVEYFSTTDYLSGDGVIYKAGERGLKREWLAKLLSRACGLSFTTQFENVDWAGNASKNFVVTLGGSEIAYSLSQDGTLNISLYNKLTTENGGLFYSTQVPDVDLTQIQEWRIARVNTLDSADSGYALRVYLNDDLIIDEYDDFGCWGSGYHGIYIDNLTDSPVTVGSALDEQVEFVEEINVLDIAEFDGREELFSAAGLPIVNSSANLSGDWSTHSFESRAVNIEWIGGFTRLSNGLQWKMKANSMWTKTGDLFRLNIGATQIHIHFNKTTQEIGTYTHTTWSSETEHVAAIAGYTKLGENYDPTAWHTWRIARVEATNARGYAVRFYIDDTLRAEIYTTGELTDKHLNEDGTYTYNEAGKGFHAVRFVNCSGTTMAFKSAYYSRPSVEKETSTDIMYYGASTELLDADGKVYASGDSAVDNYTGANTQFGQEWYAYSGGIEFMMKASKDWGNSYDELKIMLGATQIRINSKGNNKITMHVYNMAHDYVGAWGQEYPISQSFDETQWHTIKVTRRKFLRSNGYYGEKGIQVAVYIDGEKVIETVQNLSGMWAFRNRRLAVTNNSGVNIAFKSTLSKSQFDALYEFENDNIGELYEMPQHSQATYYEDAFGKGYPVKTANRIINSISSEEYSSTTNGVQFALTSAEPWKTSGTSKKPVALSGAELATVKVVNGKEMFKENGTGDYVEVALTGLSGTKYKFAYENWTSDWSRMDPGDGIRMKGETDQSAWSFPTLWKNTKGELFYSEETSTVLMTEDWMATKYHMHVDFGTLTMNFKVTPDNKMVVRVYSRYTWIVMFEDYVRDNSGNPIEFLTGTYTGNSAKTYNGKMLATGDLYENTFKISKVREVSGKGFITRVWVNGYLVCETYDSHPMGGEKRYSYLLIDNLAGTTVNAKSIATFDDFKAMQKAKLDAFLAKNYSATNRAKVNELVSTAKTTIDSMDAIINIERYVENTLEQIEGIWTVETETLFQNQKAQYLASLQAIANQTYDSSEASKISALLNGATTAFNSITEKQGFAGLRAKYMDYYEQMSQILTVEEKEVVAQARTAAKGLMEIFMGEFEGTDYIAQIQEIKASYETKINACTDIMEIEALAYAARTEMWAVEMQ